MAYHNETCGCADCGNYGQVFNPIAIHNQSCGCAECANYPRATRVTKDPTLPSPDFQMVAVPLNLLDDVHALIAKGKKS